MNRIDHAGFMECSVCSQKAGSPTLCASCLHNRARIHELDREIIICAAVRFRGKVWRGNRHNIAMEAMHDELSYKMTRRAMHKAQTDRDQGFVTSKNRYVGREEAWGIAKAAGQIIKRNHQTEGMLFSEDLY